MNIILIDDHPLFLEGFSLVVAGKLSNACVVSCKSVAEAKRRLAQQKFELCITDLYMPGSSGIELIQEIKKSYSDLPILVISQSENPRDISEAFNHGADGYLNKSSDSAEVDKAIGQILAGEKYLSIATKLLLKEFDSYEKQLHITKKQQEVLRLMAKGLINSDIASHMEIKEVTVKTHVSDLLSAFHVKNRVECILKAKALNIV